MDRAGVCSEGGGVTAVIAQKGHEGLTHLPCLLVMSVKIGTAAASFRSIILD